MTTQAKCAPQQRRSGADGRPRGGTGRQSLVQDDVRLSHLWGQGCKEVVAPPRPGSGPSLRDDGTPRGL
eukprot:5758945-Prymnesium_polylepis.2